MPPESLRNHGRHFSRVRALRARSVDGSDHVKVSQAGLNRRIGVRIGSDRRGVENQVRAARCDATIDVVPDYARRRAGGPSQVHRMR